jgi:L-alanine-DL-glutamate epimerase-like enolase superfamily enzyme
VFEPFGGFADGTPIEDGYVQLPHAPGIGFELNRNLFAVFASRL